MQNIIEKALKVFNGQTEPPPTLNSKGWWANRAIALEIELKSNQAVDEERQQPVYGISTVSNVADGMSAYREATQRDVLTHERWPAAASVLRRLNPWWTRAWEQCVLNSQDEKVCRKRRFEETEESRLAKVRREKLRGAQCEMVLSIIQRQRSQFNLPCLIVLKSMVAFRQGLNMKYWEGETRLKQLMSYNWTKDFVLDLSELGLPMPPVAKDICFCVYDNCDYYRKKALDRYDDDAEYIKTVNIASVPVPISVAGLDMREFSKCITALATWVRPMM